MFAASTVREQIIYRVEGIKRYKMYRLIYYGCSYGLLGSILMIYTIRIDSTIILDLRFLAVTEVAKIAKSVVFDESAFVARYGGEEFGILLPRANQYEAIKMAEAIRQQVEQRGIVHQASEVFKCVTISVGIMTVVPSENISPFQLFIKQIRLYMKQSVPVEIEFQYILTTKKLTQTFESAFKRDISLLFRRGFFFFVVFHNSFCSVFKLF